MHSLVEPWSIMFSAICSVLVIFVCIAAVGGVWATSREPVAEALEDSTRSFRVTQALLLSQGLARLLTPLWCTARTVSHRLHVGSTSHSPVWPPRPESFSSNATEMEVMLGAIMPLVHLDSWMLQAPNSLRDDPVSQGVTISVQLNLDEQNQTVQSGMHAVRLVSARCLFLSQVLQYMCFVQHLDNLAADPQGVSSTAFTWSPTTYKANPAECLDPYGSLFQIGEPPSAAQVNFSSNTNGNFSWSVDTLPSGSGVALCGSVPIWTEQSKEVGVVSVEMPSVTQVQRLLQSILDKGGAISKDGHVAVYSADGMVIGMSELFAPDSDFLSPPTLDSVDNSSHLHKAIKHVMWWHGEACPEGQHFGVMHDEGEDRLVDVTQFHPEDWGLPPFRHRWCQLTSVRRANLNGPVAAMERTSIVVGVIIGCGLFLGLDLFALSTALMRSMCLEGQQTKEANDTMCVLEAENLMNTLSSPMVLISATELLQLRTWQCHEELRDQRKLVFLDSLEDIVKFRRENVISLISHQWLGWAQPDTKDCVQLREMQRAITALVRITTKPLYVWLDYTSIAQRSAAVQAQAVASLPVYLSQVDHFVICAPDAIHMDTGKRCNLATYSRRGWCRAEMLAKSCASGLHCVYVVAGDHLPCLRKLTKEDFQRLSINVFEGEFRVRSDMESLVKPVLGLYSVILRQNAAQNLQSVKTHIKDRFFPKFYKVERAGKFETRVLFGNLVSVMEEHVRQHLSTWWGSCLTEDSTDDGGYDSLQDLLREAECVLGAGVSDAKLALENDVLSAEKPTWSFGLELDDVKIIVDDSGLFPEDEGPNAELQCCCWRAT